MSKFKIGDRVRILASQTEAYIQGYKGKIGTVTQTQEHPNPLLWLVWDGENKESAFYEGRFELVGPVLTDEELAAKYREGRKANLAVFDELVKRGYHITQPGSGLAFQNVGEAVNIYKYVEEEVVVTQKKQVKKEL